MNCAGCAAQLRGPECPRCGVFALEGDPASFDPPLEAFAKVVLEGRYFLERPLWRGNYSDLYLGVSLVGSEPVAVKVLQPRLCEFPGEIEAFLHRGFRMTQLRHPGLVAVPAVGNHSGRPYFVMEYVPGETLSALEGGLLPIAPALAVAVQVCDAIVAVHGAGQVHRGVRPERVRVQPDGRCVLLDVGWRGVPAYHSPEQLADPASADARSDVYALGVTVFEMLTGVLPFRGRTVEELLEARDFGAAQSPSRIRPGLPAGLDDVLATAMARSPRERFQHAAELRASLMAIIGVAERAERRGPPPLPGVALVSASALAAAAVEPPPVVVEPPPVAVEPPPVVVEPPPVVVEPPPVVAVEPPPVVAVEPPPVAVEPPPVAVEPPPPVVVEPPPVADSPRSLPVPPPPPRGGATPALALGVVALAVIGVGLWFAYSGDDAPTRRPPPLTEHAQTVAAPVPSPPPSAPAVEPPAPPPPAVTPPAPAPEPPAPPATPPPPAPEPPAPAAAPPPPAPESPAPPAATPQPPAPEPPAPAATLPPPAPEPPAPAVTPPSPAPEPPPPAVTRPPPVPAPPPPAPEPPPPAPLPPPPAATPPPPAPPVAVPERRPEAPPKKRPREVPPPAAKPRPTTLKVTSKPPGAAVRVDGKDLGATPLSSTALRPGSHVVEVSLAGHSSFEYTVNLEPGKPMSVHARLDSFASTLLITAEADGAAASARISIDGKLVAEAATVRRQVPPGTHRISAALEGYESTVQSVTVGPGEVQKLKLVLVKK